MEWKRKGLVGGGIAMVATGVASVRYFNDESLGDHDDLYLPTILQPCETTQAQDFLCRIAPTG